MDRTRRSRVGLTDATGRSVGYPAWNVLHALLLCHLDPDPSTDNLIVNVGASVGLTAIVLAQAIEDVGARGRVLAIEVDEADFETARSNVERSGLGDRVDLRRGSSSAILAAELSSTTPVRFAFLEGCSGTEEKLDEFMLILPYLSDDAIVAVSGTSRQVAPAVRDDREVLHVIRSRVGGSIVNLPYCSWSPTGLALWQGRPNAGR